MVPPTLSHYSLSFPVLNLTVIVCLRTYPSLFHFQGKSIKTPLMYVVRIQCPLHPFKSGPSLSQDGTFPHAVLSAGYLCGCYIASPPYSLSESSDNGNLQLSIILFSESKFLTSDSIEKMCHFASILPIPFGIWGYHDVAHIKPIAFGAS